MRIDDEESAKELKDLKIAGWWTPWPFDEHDVIFHRQRN